MCVFVCVLMLVHTAHVLRTFMRLNSVLNILIYGIWPYMRRYEWWFMISFFARYIFARANAPSMCSVCIRWGIDKSLTHKYLNPITFATLFFHICLHFNVCMILVSLLAWLCMCALLFSPRLIHLILHFQTLVWRVGPIEYVNGAKDQGVQMRVRVRLF